MQNFNIEEAVKFMDPNIALHKRVINACEKWKYVKLPSAEQHILSKFVDNVYPTGAYFEQDFNGMMYMWISQMPETTLSDEEFDKVVSSLEQFGMIERNGEDYQLTPEGILNTIYYRKTKPNQINSLKVHFHSVVFDKDTLPIVARYFGRIAEEGMSVSDIKNPYKIGDRYRKTTYGGVDNYQLSILHSKDQNWIIIELEDGHLPMEALRHLYKIADMLKYSKMEIIKLETGK